MQGNGQSDCFFQMLRALELSLIEFLGFYGIEPLKTSPGQPFSAKTMQMLRACPAPDPALHLKVVQSLRMGFQWSQRVLRAETVVVYQNVSV